MISQIKNNLTKNTMIRFYDNTPEMIKQFKTTLKYVEPILVSNKPNKEVLNGNPNAKIYITEFMKLYPNNKFAQYLSSIQIKELKTNIGFDKEDAYNLLKWACKPSIQNKIAIFDWDGTLSVIEGIIIPNNSKETENWKTKGINNRDIAIYYAGTKERLLWLREMFTILHKKEVRIYILTNNPVAATNWRAYPNLKLGSETRYNFFKVAKQFIPQIKENEILCGYETNCFKPDTFLKNTYLNNSYSILTQSIK
jgi:hypothetical protein